MDRQNLLSKHQQNYSNQQQPAQRSGAAGKKRKKLAESKKTQEVKGRWETFPFHSILI